MRVFRSHSITIRKDRVRVPRPFYLLPDPASRTSYEPASDAVRPVVPSEVDIPLGHGQVGRPPVLVMVSGYSRVMAAIMIPSRQGPDLIAGRWSATAQAPSEDPP